MPLHLEDFEEQPPLFRHLGEMLLMHPNQLYYSMIWELLYRTPEGHADALVKTAQNTARASIFAIEDICRKRLSLTVTLPCSIVHAPWLLGQGYIPLVKWLAPCNPEVLGSNPPSATLGEKQILQKTLPTHHTDSLPSCPLGGGTEANRRKPPGSGTASLLQLSPC